MELLQKNQFYPLNIKTRLVFLGGTVPIVKNISQINNNITFISLYNQNSLKDKIHKYLGKKVKLKFFKQKNYQKLIKIDL